MSITLESFRMVGPSHPRSLLRAGKPNNSKTQQNARRYTPTQKTPASSNLFVTAILFIGGITFRRTTQAQRRRPRIAAIGTTARCRRSLQRLGVLLIELRELEPEPSEWIYSTVTWRSS